MNVALEYYVGTYQCIESTAIKIIFGSPLVEALRTKYTRTYGENNPVSADRCCLHYFGMAVRNSILVNVTEFA